VNDAPVLRADAVDAAAARARAAARVVAARMVLVGEGGKERAKKGLNWGKKGGGRQGLVGLTEGSSAVAALSSDNQRVVGAPLPPPDEAPCHTARAKATGGPPTAGPKGGRLAGGGNPRCGAWRALGRRPTQRASRSAVGSEGVVRSRMRARKGGGAGGGWGPAAAARLPARQERSGGPHPSARQDGPRRKVGAGR
jgi:hypothetical protein